MIALIISLSVVAFIALIIVITNIKIVRQTEKHIIERFGAYKTTKGVGIYMKIPFVDRVAYRISMKEQVRDFDPQNVITKDNVTMKIDTVVFYQVTDPKLYAYGTENPIKAIDYLSSTTLRNIIGDLDLDETLTSRDLINEKMRKILDEATDPWGIKVNRVELKNILPPADIREAMERQMRAEREKREKVLLAEGEKQSAILVAQGKKESAILNADAEKQSTILRAQGQAESVRQLKAAEAEGLRLMRQAEADGIKALKEAGADQSVLTLRYYDALAKVADGKATKIILPNEGASLASAANIVAESIRKE